jgi:hypothetical protein
MLIDTTAAATLSDMDFTTLAAGSTSFTDDQGNTWSVYGSAEISGRNYRFHGEVASLPQQWDPSGADIWAPVTAGGLLRRLGSGQQAPVISPMRRAILAQSGTLYPAAYWPCEDLAGATSAGSATGGPAMNVSGTASFAADSGFACSAAIPQWNGSAWYGAVPSYTPNGALVVRFLLHSTSAPPDNTVMCRVIATGTVQEFSVHYRTGGALELEGWDSQGNNLFDTGAVSFAVDNALLWVSMEMQQSGSKIQYSITTLAPGAASASTFSGTLANATVGRVLQVQVNPFQKSGTVAMGHIQAQGAWQSLFGLSQPLNAFTGEAAGDRFARLCSENGVPGRVYGAPATTVAMGAQAIDTLVNLLQACETADMGQIYEPPQALGLGYRTQASLYSQSPAVTLDYAQDHLDFPLTPTDDDQFTVNDVTVNRDNGSGYRQALNDGSAMSISPPPVGVGDYENSYSLSLASDSQLPDAAGWLLHRGTVNEERYPVAGVNVANTDLTSMVPVIAGVQIGDYLQIVNPPSWLPPGSINQIAYQFTEDLGDFAWRIAWNCVPESPYEVGIYGDAVYGRLDTDGSTLATACGTTDTSLRVTSPGAIWTTQTGDFPFDVTIGGEQMTVAAISGSGSTQTFTLAARSVNGVVKAHAAGEAVNLTHPAILAMV